MIYGGQKDFSLYAQGGQSFAILLAINGGAISLQSTVASFMLNPYAHEKSSLSVVLSLHTGATRQPLSHCPAILTMGTMLMQFHAGLPCA